MPPRLPWHLPVQAIALFQNVPRVTPTVSSFSIPQCHTQNRAASILSQLSDNKSAYNHRIRRGRGPASGKGKTSGRGHKGQKQHGKVPAGFTGGQTPIEIVHGRQGFENIWAPELAIVNLDRLQDWIDQGRINPNKPITVRELAQSRCIHGVKDGVKLLARGATHPDGRPILSQPLQIVVSRASAAAIDAVEHAGGSVVTRYYTRHAIRRILDGRTDPYVSRAWDSDQYRIGMGTDAQLQKGNGFQYRLPDPTSRKDIEYYRDPAHRGYLSHLVGEEETPSLFFLAPSAAKWKKTTDSEQEVAENRVW